MRFNYNSLLIALAAFLWATDTLLRLPLVRDLSATTIVSLEHLFALVFILPLLIKYWRQIKQLTGRQWLGVAFIALAASALATIAFITSFRYVNPSVSILLQKIQPLVTLSLAAAVLREKLSRRFYIYAALAIGGAYLVSFPRLLPDLTLYQNGLIGVGLALLAAVLWGSATVVGRALLKDLPPNLLTALRFAVALPFLFIVWLGNATMLEVGILTWRHLIYLLIIMIGPGWGAMYLYYKGLAVTKASQSALLELVWPFSAVILNWIFLQAALSLSQIIGAALLLWSVTRVTLWAQGKN